MASVVDEVPTTFVESVVESVHGIEVVDPYRWLENQHSDRTRSWLKEQNIYASAYFASLAERPIVRSRIGELLSASLVAEPWSVGNRYFFLKRQDGKEQAAIVVRDGLFGDDNILVDPASYTSDATISVAICAISEDGRFLAYS